MTNTYNLRSKTMKAANVTKKVVLTTPVRHEQAIVQRTPIRQRTISMNDEERPVKLAKVRRSLSFNNEIIMEENNEEANSESYSVPTTPPPTIRHIECPTRPVREPINEPFVFNLNLPKRLDFGYVTI